MHRVYNGLREHIDMLASAYLIAEGYTQIEVAKRLRISQSAVSRLLAEARKDYLRTETRFLREKLDDQTLKEVVKLQHMDARYDRWGWHLSVAEKLGVAYLAAQGYSQKQIAWKLGISQSTVSRLLAEARKDYLRTETRFLREKLDDRTLEQVLNRVSRSALIDRIDRLSKSESARPGPMIITFPTERWPSMAAAYVKSLLETTDTCGVGWGQTINLVAKYILGPPLRTGDPVTFFPVCGELREVLPGWRSASMIAARLEEVINGRDLTLSLCSLPAYIPSNLSRTETRGINKFIEKIDGKTRIFGKSNNNDPNETPLIKRASTILTSVEAIESDYGRNWWREEIGSLSTFAYGDIVGHFIVRPHLEPREEADVIEAVQSRWTGVRVPDLVHCVATASRVSGRWLDRHTTAKHGVVVLALGQAKAKALVELAKLGISSIWVIDSELEAALDDVFKTGDLNPSRSMQG